MTTATRRSLLAQLTGGEHGRVLGGLLRAHPELGEEAEQLAGALLAAVDRAAVVADVVEVYLEQSYMDIGDRCGRQPGRGYVHETDAQIELLHEALEPFTDEIARLARLGFSEAAVQHALGVLDGIDRLRHVAGESTLIGWGALEDNTADLATGVLFACRDAALELPDEDVPDHWHGLL